MSPELLVVVIFDCSKENRQKEVTSEKMDIKEGIVKILFE